MPAKKQLEVGSKIRLVQYKIKGSHTKGTNFDLRGEITDITNGPIPRILIQYNHMPHLVDDNLHTWLENARYHQGVWTLEA